MTSITQTRFGAYTNTVSAMKCSETKTPFDNEPCEADAVVESWADPGTTVDSSPFVPAHAIPAPRCALHHRIFARMAERHYKGGEVHERPIGQ